MASLKEFLGSTGLGALWARITEELNKKATSADLADVATSGSYNDLEDKPFIPSAVSDLTDDSGHYTKPANGIPASDLEETYLTSFTETDPTVPNWAKEAEKPAYTAAEVGAMATDHPANDITAVNIETWTKKTNLFDVSSDHNNAYDYWWTLTIPRDALWNIHNAPGTSGKLKYLYVPSTEGKNLIKLELPTTNGKLALITDVPTVPTNVSAFTNDAGYLTQHQDISGKADKSEIPTSVSELTNDAGYITGYTETDPTVPAWAKASTKPSYTAAEVGAPTVAEMNGAIGDAIGNVHQFEVEIVQELPVENIKEHTVYFVPKSGATDDVYDEYIYIDNAWEMIGNTQIDLSNYATKGEIPSVPVQDIQINETSIVGIDGVATIPFGNQEHHGVVIGNAAGGVIVDNQTGELMLSPASSNAIKQGNGAFKPIIASKQHEAVFYGMAKAAGDTTQAQSDNTVGTYTDAAKTAIRTMLGVATPADIPTNVSAFTNDAGYLTQHQDISGKANIADLATVATSGSYEDLSNKPTIPEVPVQDVQINNVSILNNGIAEIPKATGTVYGAVKAASGNGVFSEVGTLYIFKAPSEQIKAGSHWYRPIVPYNQHESVFYGLAKVAGHDEKDSTESVGTYTDGAKAAIQNMLGITNLLSTEEFSTATAAHALNSTFMMDGKLYKATAAIVVGDAVVEGQNCEVVKADEVFVKNTDKATDSAYGIVKIGSGLTINGTNGTLQISAAGTSAIKQGASGVFPIVPYGQHEAVFYGLSKVAGVDLKNETVTFGTYPETSKTAIRSLIGAIGTTDYATSTTGGTIRVNTANGVNITNDGQLFINQAATNNIKQGTANYFPIVPSHQHEATFYGLAKVAGADMSSSSNAVGTYTESAKTAIRSMIGATSSNIVAVQDTQPVEADAKIWMMETAPESVQIPTMEDLEGYVQKTDYAAVGTYGLVKLGNYSGISLDSTGYIKLYWAGENAIKIGTSTYTVINPSVQHISAFYGLAKAAGDTTQSASSNAVGTYTDDAKTAIRSMLGVPGDVQVNGTSVVQNGIANIPAAVPGGNYGTVRLISGVGIGLSDNGNLMVLGASSTAIKNGTNTYTPIMPQKQNEATFYGLAKAAGDSTQSLSNNAVGTYTTEAKAAIRNMLGIETSIELIETVSGTTPTIVGQPNVTYQCGEVSTISITPPANGTIDVYFTSGSTAAALTVPSTIKWPAWFDAEALESDTIYELIITNGTYGSVMTWQS